MEVRSERRMLDDQFERRSWYEGRRLLESRWAGPMSHDSNQQAENSHLPASRFGARLRQAVISGLRTAPFLAARNRTFVAPPRPQPPLTGAKAAGWVLTKSSCCSGVSLPMAQPL